MTGPAREPGLRPSTHAVPAHSFDESAKEERKVSNDHRTDHRALHWWTTACCTRAVRRVRRAHLDLPTPCEGWTVRDLLRHMVGHNRGFAAALEGRATQRSVWDGLDLGVDPSPHWDDSARRVIAAFAARPSLASQIEVLGFGDVPVAQAVRMHAIDCLAHAWDVSVSIGHRRNLDEEACAEVLEIAEDWPPGHPAIWGPDAPFGYPVAVPAESSAADRMLGLLGRSPTWPR